MHGQQKTSTIFFMLMISYSLFFLMRFPWVGSKRWSVLWLNLFDQAKLFGGPRWLVSSHCCELFVQIMTLGLQKATESTKMFFFSCMDEPGNYNDSQRMVIAMGSVVWFLGSDLVDRR